MEADHGVSVGRCGAGLGALPKTFLRPCLLLLLREQPGYGYDLVSRLQALGIDDDAATVYRALRTLENNHAVSSYWHTSSSGPARHMYRLTPTGEEELQTGVSAAIEMHLAIERYLCRYALAQPPPLRLDDRESGRMAFGSLLRTMRPSTSASATP